MKIVKPLQAFGFVLRRERKKLGLSQLKFAARTGLHFNYISKLERGLKNPTFLVIRRISSSLELNPLDFLTMVEGEIQDQP